MTTRAVALVAVTWAIVFAACAWDQPNPSAFKPVPGNPCGNLGVECSGHMCCNEGEACGGDPGCPSGMCCDAREPPAFGMSADEGRDEAGARRPMHPERRP
jgi:hypothetical protein